MTLQEMIAFCSCRRTDRAISSYITEELFADCFLNGNQRISAISTGWYYSSVKPGSQCYAFLLKNEVSDLDFEIIGALDIPVWQIITDGETIELQNLSGEGNNRLSLEQFVAEKQLIVKPRKTPNLSEEERTRINRYCLYLNERNALGHVVDTIRAEDNFLNKYFRTTNLDFFIKNQMGILLFEVKFKYPAVNGCFGINNMQAQVLSYFQDKGIEAFNIILNNPEKMDVIEYINQGRDNWQWLYSRVEITGGLATAPQYTNYFNQTQQQYFNIPVRKYKALAYTNNIIDMQCPQCGSDLCLRNGRYGPFLGCTQYGRTNCTGKINL